MEKLGLLYNDVIRYIKLSKWKTSQSAWCSLYTRNLSAKPSGATATKRPKKKIIKQYIPSGVIFVLLAFNYEMTGLILRGTKHS